MNNTDDKLNYNWIYRDQVQSKLPIVNKSVDVTSKEKGHSIDLNNQLLPTVNEIKQLDECFIESIIQYKNLYIQLAKYIDNDKVTDENSLARRILSIASRKISEVEKLPENRSICREMIKSIGEVAIYFIDISLNHNKGNKLLELFNEAIARISRTNKSSSVKCILEEYEAVSEATSISSRSISSSSSRQKTSHLTDWFGNDVSRKYKK
jgi:hemerythrin-like domain-containing protein